MSTTFLVNFIFLYCRQIFANFYENDFLFIVGGACAALADIKNCACPYLAIDLVVLSPELRKVVAFYSFLYFDLSPNEGASSLAGTI